MSIVVDSNQGGSRKGAGRPEVNDKKLQVNVMIKGSIIKHIGGTDNHYKNRKKVQTLLLDLLDKYLEMENAVPDDKDDQLLG